ncbi:MAG: cytochrome b/b6 domain-containing protein [Gammaproteobacteria bacterium]|nr:cytochrome b/b6 domain-containing protein [Gammaproteobacteria bacterium]
MVWDPLLRLFHWSLVFFFFLAYLFESDQLNLHGHAGYTVLLLLLFRLVWGVIGSRHARFSDFVVSPANSFLYLKQLFSGTANRHIGHNPAGSAMILVLLISLLITAFSGTCLFAMEGSGPLANTFVSSWPGHVVEEVHEFFSNFTLILIIVHVVGVLLTSLLHKENLTKAMITGEKRRNPDLSGNCVGKPYHGKNV